MELGRHKNFIVAVLASNLLSVLFFILRAADAGNFRYWFLLWNVFLAWIPLILAYFTTRMLRENSWLAWKPLLLTALWLVFLPNSFYVLSDFIHLHETGEVSVLYDVVFFFSCTFNAFLAGFISVFLIHEQLAKRVRRRDSHVIIAAVFLLCGLAIYLGRYLRWNSWDIIINPAGLLFDVSDKIINPIVHPQFITTTLSFFLLLSFIYAILWQFAGNLSGNRSNS